MVHMYSGSIRHHLTIKNNNHVPKQENSAFCRPIKIFWGIMKDLVYKNNWHAENLKKLRSRIKYYLDKVDIELIRILAQSLPGLVDEVRWNGLIENN